MLPLVLLLCGLAVFRDRVWPALVAVLLVGYLGVLTLLGVASYEPSDDPDVMADQTVGWGAVRMYALGVVMTGLPLMWVVGTRLLRRRGGKACC
jgi:hypothetical protein